VQIYCSNGQGYWGFGNGSFPQSADTRKAWLSLAQAAFLSGKKVFIEYEAGNALTFVKLQN
jgi:hypothetical protein